MHSIPRTVLFSTLLAVSAFTGCAGGKSDTKTAVNKKSLYDRLGGKGAITAVVDDFVGKVAGDARINARFVNADIPHLKAMLVEQICEASGGPCKYTGKDMKTSHTGMNITNDEFNALVDDLGKTLNQFKVPADAQKDLIGALAPMQPDIVGR